MHSRLSILFLISCSSLLSVVATVECPTTQVPERQSENTPEFDAHLLPSRAYGNSTTDHAWPELASWLSPAQIADRIQETPFIFPFIGIPLSTCASAVQPDVRPSSSFMEDGFVVFRRRFERMLLEEAGKLIRSFETAVNSTVTLSRVFNNGLKFVTSDNIPSNHVLSTALLGNVAELVAVTRNDFQNMFPFSA